MSQKEKILSMVAEGKINAEEGEKLLRAVNNNLKKEENNSFTTPIKKEGETNNNSRTSHLKGKLIINIESSEGDNVKVNLPLKLASLAINMLPEDKISNIEKEGVDIRTILNNINEIVEDLDGDLVNIESSNGDVVRIYIEKK